MNASRSLSLALVAVAATYGTLGPCLPIASRCHAADTAMICAWHRTFHAYNGLHSPLRNYYMNRRPNCYCWGAVPAGWSQSAGPPLSWGPVGFERMGQIPNDVDVTIGAPAR
jgi:hypothetical protein